MHGVDAEHVDIGAAAHDLARALRRRDLLSEAERLGLQVDPVQRGEPVLLHGPIAAAWLRTEDSYGVEPILESVHHHTTGHAGMSDVAKVVFLGDKLDPAKVNKYPYLERVLAKARVDLDWAILEYLDRNIDHFVVSESLIHPASIELRNDLLIRRR